MVVLIGTRDVLAQRGWQLRWNPQLLWVGLSWHRTPTLLALSLCLLPMLQLHVWWWPKDRRQSRACLP